MRPSSNIDQLFRNGANRLTVSPATSTWGRIERRLDRRRPQMPRGWWALAAAALVGFFLLSVWLWPAQQQQDPIVNTDFYSLPTEVQELRPEDGDPRLLRQATFSREYLAYAARSY